MGNFCCEVLPKPQTLLAITPLISIQTCQLLSQQILMLLCLHLKTGRYLVPTGQTPHFFTRPSILVHPRKGLHKPPIIGGGGRYCPDVPEIYYPNFNVYSNIYNIFLLICQRHRWYSLVCCFMLGGLFYNAFKISCYLSSSKFYHLILH